MRQSVVRLDDTATGDQLPENNRSEKLIRRLYEITSNDNKGFGEQTRELLAMPCERFELEIGILSPIDFDRYRIMHPLCPDGIPLEDDIEFH